MHVRGLASEHARMGGSVFFTEENKRYSLVFFTAENYVQAGDGDEKMLTHSGFEFLTQEHHEPKHTLQRNCDNESFCQIAISQHFDVARRPDFHSGRCTMARSSGCGASTGA